MKTPPPTANEADAAPRGRERRCAASGETLPEARLVRFALAPDGLVIPDVAAKLPGRGVWVEASRERVGEAVKRGAFARSFKAQARVEPDMADRIEALLAKRCLDLLGLLRKAGAVAFGQTQVEAAIRKGPLPALIEASDGAEAGREDLSRLHFGLWRSTPPVAACFTAAELGMALGRDRVIHACLLQERQARAWAVEIGRLSGFRPIVPRSWPSSWRSLGLGLDGAGSQTESRAAPETPGVEETLGLEEVGAEKY